jgi:CRP-like cAMP-binding protein
VHEADDWLALMSTGPARSRVARLLLHFAEAGEPAGSGRVFLPGREDLGAMLAITTETASRVIATFRREGLVSDLHAGTAAIDRTRLEELAFAPA